MLSSPQRIEFQALVKPFVRLLNNTAFRLTRSNLEAEDLLQETFYKSLKSFNTYERNTNFKAWIFRIMTNMYITHYRKTVKRPQKFSNDESTNYAHVLSIELSGKKFNSFNPDFEVFEDEVKSALEKIPYYFRLVVLLTDVEEFSYQDISTILNIPVDTLMARLYRGRSLLRSKIYNYDRNAGYLSN